MNIKRIREVVNNEDLTDVDKEFVIIDILSRDKYVIVTLLKLLDAERKRSQELIDDSNYELSRAVVVLNDKDLKWGKKIVTNPKWVVGEIQKHYEKWKDNIKCNFVIK